MGTESFIINHKTKEIFSVRGFWRYKEDELLNALSSKEKLLVLLADYGRKDYPGHETYIEWLVDELFEFCQDTKIDQIGFCRDWDDYSDGDFELMAIVSDAVQCKSEYSITKDAFRKIDECWQSE